MSSFPNATKYLNLVPARKATAGEAAQANIPLTKYYTLRPTRAITKVPIRFILPAFTEAFNAQHLSRLVFQYNYTASTPFYIRKIIGDFTSINLSGILMLKMISGGVSTRYKLAGISPTSYAINYPLYKANIVAPIFSIEFYNTAIPFSNVTGIDNNLTIVTSLMNDPVSADVQSIDYPIPAPFNIPQLGFNMPVPMPIVQPTIYYGSN